MQKLMREIKPDLNYRKSILKMEDVDVDSILEDSQEKGHSPYAFEKITLWLRYQRGMTVDDIIGYLSNYKDDVVDGLPIHKNSWFRWSSPNHKLQSNNIYHETWVCLKKAINALLIKDGRDIDDFTHEVTYSPATIKHLREALGLNHKQFASIVGFTNGEIAMQLENDDPKINKRGVGFDDWLELIQRVKEAQNLKGVYKDNPLIIIQDGL